MNQQVMVKQTDSGMFAALKKVPPHFLFGALLFAALWLMAQYFVTQKEYEKDQSNVNQKLTEMAGDIKELLKRR
jgi:hypothetical protein